ncbi:MAG TPA: hypothetical protein QGI71_09610 [Dehalococcoidia bacterium]|nr:hypothetical protein [Dehalococcoidia bacterium]
MAEYTNDLGQPIGAPLADWSPSLPPPRTAMEGRLVRLEPLDAARHAKALHAAHSEDHEGRNRTYLPYGPFASTAEYTA